MSTLAVVVTAVAVSSLGWAIYLIVAAFKKTFDEASEHRNEIIKECSELNHNETPTPAQLVDFFNRPRS